MGIDWDTAKVRIATCGRVRCEPGWRLDRRWSEGLADLDLWYVWAGRGTMVMRHGRQVALRRGVCMWMRPGGLYLAEQDPSQRLGVAYVHFDILDAHGVPIRDDARLPAEVHEVEDVVYADHLLRHMGEMVHWQEADRRAAEHLLTGFAMQLASGSRGGGGAGAGAAMHHRRLVLDAAARIRESPSEAPDVATLASEAGYSSDHFARVFRSVMGQSPQEFIVQARVDRARQLLSESGLTVSQIADVLGYRDVYFFSRQFKQRTGRSPSAYRRGA